MYGNMNIKHILRSVIIFENLAVYESMWENTVQPARPQLNILCMHIACWIPKATNTHSLCNTHYSSTATTAAPTRFNVTVRVHCPSCVSVAYPGFFFWGGGVQQIQLRTEGRENGDLGAVAP
jgi:hypothetical protein